ncbi:helicase C-terminal domain-containing protein [Desulfococcaceae bacterium HSG8]|nr:helicase C-terminal domain-containing protein [Desulfococcaceae bacterium HSG8]
MLKSYHDDIGRLAFIYGHSGLKSDKKNRIYSVAAAIIDTDGSKKEFDSLVRYDLLTGRERYYSNISREMLRDSPEPETVIAELGAFLKEQKFAFVFDNHNDLGALQKFCENIRIADISFACEFFLPHLESYTPRRIWEHVFGKKRDKICFTAPEMVALSVEVVKHICGGPLNDRIFPRAAAIRHYLEKSDTLFGKAFVHITKNYKEYFGGLFDSCSVTDTSKWKQFLEKAEKPSRKKTKKETFKKISPDHLETLYRGMADAGKGFVFRHEQTEYARHVTDALNDNAILTIEAGTGTGKTQGYLIPVMEFLQRNNNARIAISTYTKSLQQQIFQREIAFTREIFNHYQDIPIALLKGKSSYICAEKLGHVYEEELGGERLLTWLYFVNLVFHFRDADRDSVGEKIKSCLNADFYFGQMFAEISARDGCTPRHKRCPAQVVTSEASSARLVVTNHHKLALLDQDAILSGLFTNYVIDEANHFENAVRSAFGEEVSSWEISGTIRSLLPSVTRVLKRAAGNLATDIGKSLAAMDAVRQLIRTLRHSLGAMNPKAGSGQVTELPYEHPAFQREHIGERINELKGALKDIGENLKLIRDTDICRALKIQPKTREKIRISIHQTDDYATSLGAVEESFLSADKVTAFQCFSKNWTLMAQSVEIGDLIRRNIYEKKDCIIYTAATLCHKGSFMNFRRITGMDQPLTDEEGEPVKVFRFELIPSPFSGDAMDISVPPDAVNGRYDNKEAWIKTIAAILPELIEQNRGRTLVLFSSYSDLNLISERTAESLTNYPVLIQQQGSPTINLCDEFREIKESVLFGVDTFWYGVDFKGDTLTQVIITRIPYPSPSEPIQMARKKIMSSKDYWSRYYYDTEIKVKQGIGRLIRCDTDRGKVVILDSRYRF